jgi:preprotein translocase subunit SecB
MGSMAEGNSNNQGNLGGQQATDGGPQIKARVLAQYIKDLSFENPNVHRLFENPGSSPNLQIEVNVNVAKMKDKVFESAIEFKAQASNDGGVVYDLELSYAGLFEIDSMPDQMVEPFLLVNCPTLIFPYLRRLVQDLTREGGFPPLVLDPIDFGGLYVSRQRERMGQTPIKLS